MTLKSSLAYSAPGKMMISGEYAVLFDFPALVMAVDCRAKTTLHPASKLTVKGIHEQCFEVVKSDNKIEILGATPQDQLKLFEVALNYFYEFQPLPTFEININTSSFFDVEGRKMGLGSSAAATVSLTAALLRAQTGKNPAPNDTRLHAQAIHHRLNEGYGSGADIYASVFGGVFRYSINDKAIRHIQPWQNEEWAFLPVFTGHSQRSKTWVAHIQEWATVESQEAQKRFQQINDASLMLQRALETQNGPQLRDGLQKGAVAMNALGQAVQLDIFDRHNEAIGHIAEQFGGSAKPSGAGGGDVALVFLPKNTLSEFKKEALKQELKPIDLHPFAIGCSQLVL
jgi:phosphomevalonate kinase